MHSSSGRHVGYILLLSIGNNSTMNKDVQIPLLVPAFNYSGCIPRSGIIGLHGNSMLKLFEELPHYFHSSSSISSIVFKMLLGD